MNPDRIRSAVHRACVPAAAAFCLCHPGWLMAAPIKVDISNTSRTASEGQDPAYTHWSTTDKDPSMSQTFGGVTVKFTRIAPTSGTEPPTLQTSYWKLGVQSTTYNVKLTADGLKIKDGDAGAQIEMRVSGLAAGPHTLLLWLNNWDPATSNAPLDILVNGTQVVDNLPVTTQVTDNNLASTAYLGLNATAGQDVVVLVKADTTAGGTVKNVHINGFEIDAENTKAQANNPVPDNADEHVNADTGAVTLSWGSATLGAASHNVYLGTSESAVTNATTASQEFKGNQTARTYPVTGISPHLTYYWRIDEVASGGVVTKGNIWYFRPRRLAFPGAEGYGRFARGGRGGVVVHVTNLNDSGAGSLRDAVLGNYGPRTVVFDVSGLLTLSDDIIIGDTLPYITVAGQTAPGKGICIKRQQFGTGGRDVIIRYVRGLVGKESGETQNATGMSGADHSIMDHCSFGWGIDEGLSTRGGKNLTFQWCSLSEALNIAGHDHYPAGDRHGFAASIGGDIGSFHHNLLAHNEGRNWSLAGGLDGSGYFAGRMDITNNVVYNWGGRTTDGGAHEVNFVGNYYKPTVNAGPKVALTAQHDNFPGTQQYYFAGNKMPGYWDETNQTAGRNGELFTPYPTYVNAPFFPSYVDTQTATNAYKRVVSDAGCTLPMIDNRDKRIAQETLNGTFTYKGSVSGDWGLPDTTNDVGGWEDYGTEIRPAGFDTDEDGMPDWWETLKGFNPNSAANDFTESNSDADGNGYTALEEYLNWMALPHQDVNAGASIDVDLQALSTGYSKTTPTYTFPSTVGGTVTLISGRYARFTPTTAANALGSFAFTVKDSANDTMTRTVNVRILGTGVGSPLAAPTSLNATSGSGQVSLSWTAVSGATGYIVKRSTISGGTFVTVASPSGTSYSDIGLAAATTYYYVVSAVNGDGESLDSGQVSATTAGPDIPPVPAGLSATPGNTKVSLSWTASAGATGYNVKRSTTNGSGYTTIASPTTASYTSTGLANGTTYYYVVTAVNSTGESANSAQASATPAGNDGGGIVVEDSPSAIVSGSGTSFTTPVTVTPGSKVLVVLIGNMKETDQNAPPKVTWNDQTLTKAVMISSGSTGAKSSIFYLYNPVSDGAAHNLSCTFTAGTTSWRFQYYTLSGVNTAVAPLPGSVTGSTATITSTVNNCPANGLAVLNAFYSNNVSPVTLPAYGSGILNALYVSDSSPTCALGYAKSIAAGTDTFSAMTTAASSKFSLSVAVFTPASSAPLPEVTIVATDATAGEYGTDQSLAFTISRTGGNTSALTVPLVASGSATPGTDYSGFASSVSIPSGQSSVVLPLTVLADALAEGPESVTISLGASANFTAGTPASDSATIADKPSQTFYFGLVADPTKRGPFQDADGDGDANIAEYFMGTNPGDAGSKGAPTIPAAGSNTFKVHYPRAKDRPDVVGALRWSADLKNWFASGQSDGARTITFTEAVVSAAGADPETVEATATVSGAGATNIFIRLAVQ